MTKPISQGEDVEDTAQTADPTVETDTTDTSSNVNETDQETGESGSALDTKVDDGKTVPYERFREVNEKAKRVDELEDEIQRLKGQAPKTEIDPKKEQVKEALKPILEELGYVSKEELAKIDEDKQVQSEISTLEKQFDGKDGRPKFVKEDVIKYALQNKIGSVEVAYKQLHEKELINWYIKKAQAESKGFKTESSDGSGSSEVGVTNDDLKEGIVKGDKTALHTFLKRVTRTTPK